ncbi:MAG: riboflavin synthase [Parcubacteria group bacterium]|nr:riboflavin synthase [Parcubacteria group bacterium]
MFTGIIKEIGEIKTTRQEREVLNLEISSQNAIKDLEIGSSIAVDGTCQTVVELSDGSFTIQVIPETLKLTTLGKFKKGDKVNLESAMKIGDDISGHLLTGHIDGTGKITDIKQAGETAEIKIKPPVELVKYIAHKGSIALDGISLTVAQCDNEQFKVAIIPHTLQETTLGAKKVGDLVNLEIDILARYVERMMNVKGGGLDKNKLEKEGFI